MDKTIWTRKETSLECWGNNQFVPRGVDDEEAQFRNESDNKRDEKHVEIERAEREADINSA